MKFGINNPGRNNIAMAMMGIQAAAWGPELAQACRETAAGHWQRWHASGGPGGGVQPAPAAGAGLAPGAPQQGAPQQGGLTLPGMMQPGQLPPGMNPQSVLGTPGMPPPLPMPPR
jgi:hypothetical protein